MAAVSLKFPIFAVVAKHGKSSLSLFVAGGGGASKTGVPNAVHVYEVSESRTLTQTSTVSTGSRAVMCLAVHPTEDAFVCGLDEDCALFTLAGSEYKETATTKVNEDKSGQGYVKAVAFSPTGKFAASVGTDGQARLLKYPEMTVLVVLTPPPAPPPADGDANKTPISSPISSPTKPTAASELNDVSINHNGTLVAGVMNDRILVWSDQGKLVHSIAVSTALTHRPSNFRACRFGIAGRDKKPVLLAAVNAKDRKSSWVGLWTVGDGYHHLQTTPIYNKAISSVHINDELGVASFGMADGSVGAVNMRRFKQKYVRREAHSLAVTSTTLSKLGNDIVLWSGSADHSIQATGVVFEGAFWWNLAILLALLAIAIGYWMSTQMPESSRLHIS